MTYTERFLETLRLLPDAAIYLLLGVSAFIENVFPPIPGDTITAFGAFLVGVGRLSLAGVFAATTAGSLAGFLTLFWVGSILGRHFFIERDYRFLRAVEIEKAERWFARYGYFLIALNRFLPGIRSAISLTAGISRLRLGPVSLLALLSCSVWNFVWIAAGYGLGTRWETVEENLGSLMAKYNTAAILVCCLFVLVALLKWKRGRRV